MCLRAEIRVATSSMTSVPKPLKILREYYEQLKDAYGTMVIVLISYDCILFSI